MSHKGELLTIQRFVFLLDDFHYKEFVEYLKDSNAALPLKLTETIRKKLPEFDSHETLCKKVYGSCSQKANFNQLSSYTFKLSESLAQNYPDYLHHNIAKIERLVNECNANEALFLAENLFNIGSRIEDFSSHTFSLQFLAQQAFLERDSATGFKYDKELEVLLESQRTFQKIIASLRRTLYDSSLMKQEGSFEKLKTFYKQYRNHSSVVVRIAGQYAYLYTVYYFNPQMFDAKEDLALIENLQKELHNYSYVVFPFLFDIKGIFGFLTLNSSLINLDSTEGKKYFNELTEHYEGIKFWKNYLNMPQIFSIAVQASRFVSAYHYSVHRSDYEDVVSAKDLKTIQSLIANCKEIIERNEAQQHYTNDLISVRMLYGALLILSGGNGIKQGVYELESVLTTYQQINISSSTDSIFLGLMIGYFSLKKYEKCSDTYKRYQKVIRGKTVYEGNDISIHTYYYLSRWFDSGHKQYLDKIKSNSLRTKSDAGPGKAIQEFIKYFELPITI